MYPLLFGSSRGTSTSLPFGRSNSEENVHTQRLHLGPKGRDKSGEPRSGAQQQLGHGWAELNSLMSEPRMPPNGLKSDQLEIGRALVAGKDHDRSLFGHGLGKWPLFRWPHDLSSVP